MTQKLAPQEAFDRVKILYPSADMIAVTSVDDMIRIRENGDDWFKCIPLDVEWGEDVVYPPVPGYCDGGWVKFCKPTHKHPFDCVTWANGLDGRRGTWVQLKRLRASDRTLVTCDGGYAVPVYWCSSEAKPEPKIQTRPAQMPEDWGKEAWFTDNEKEPLENWKKSTIYGYFPDWTHGWQDEDSTGWRHAFVEVTPQDTQEVPPERDPSRPIDQHDVGTIIEVSDTGNLWYKRKLLAIGIDTTRNQYVCQVANGGCGDVPMVISPRDEGRAMTWRFARRIQGAK